MKALKLYYEYERNGGINRGRMIHLDRDGEVRDTCGGHVEVFER